MRIKRLAEDQLVREGHLAPEDAHRGHLGRPGAQQALLSSETAGPGVDRTIAPTWRTESKRISALDALSEAFRVLFGVALHPTNSLGLRVDLVPDAAGQGVELVGVDVHLEEPGAQVIALLAGVVDVVDPSTR